MHFSHFTGYLVYDYWEMPKNYIWNLDVKFKKKKKKSFIGQLEKK